MPDEKDEVFERLRNISILVGLKFDITSNLSKKLIDKNVCDFHFWCRFTFPISGNTYKLGLQSLVFVFQSSPHLISNITALAIDF